MPRDSFRVFSSVPISSPHPKLVWQRVYEEERLQRFVPRLVQLLAEWTETFPYDFRDERVMGHVKSITQKVAAVDGAARQEVSALLQNLLLRLTALERYEEGLARLATEATTEQLSQDIPKYGQENPLQ
ncbi:ras-GEF domain-containing family member 1B-B-like [Lasioglossum baleicum]|uniref:ras-GEF domain-containing family member 1B-B-like n=1 Tax=Lasioglossum baleicum TaxID=434251 RepID=UPI003FCEA42A